MPTKNLIDLFNNEYKIIFNTIFIELTNACNLNCIHCYNDSGNDNLNIEIPFRDIKKILDNVKQYGCNHVVLSGGETLMYTNLTFLIKWLRKQDFDVLLITNSLLLSEKKVLFLMENNIKIQISVDGYNATTNDSIRGKGIFKKIVDVLKILNTHSYMNNVYINVVLNCKNFDKVLYYKDFCKQYNINNLSFNIVNEIGRAKSNKLGLTSKQYVQITRDTKTLNKCFNVQEIRPSFNCRLALPSNGNYFLSPVVSYSGDVFLCEKLRNNLFSIGNIRNNTISEIFYSSRFKELVGLILLRNVFINCENCFLNDFCERGCPADGANLEENLFATCKCNEKKLWYIDNIGKI